MKKTYFSRSILYFVFLLSILLIFFSLFKIYYANNSVKESLKEWDSNISASPESLRSATDKKYIPVKYKYIPVESEVFGKIIINGSKEIIPLIQGTSVKDLERGAGHYTTTYLPGEKGNSVIFGHRDGIFNSLKDVNISDNINIETQAGILVFKIVDTKIVLPEDPVILEKYEDVTVTLVTCYPFYYIGSAPKRFIVIAKLIV